MAFDFFRTFTKETLPFIYLRLKKSFIPLDLVNTNFSAYDLDASAEASACIFLQVSRDDAAAWNPQRLQL